MSAPTPPPAEGNRHPAADEDTRRTTGEDSRRAEEPARRSGLGAILSEDEFSVSDAIGGPRGILESVLPTLLFVVLFVATRSVKIAALSAVAVVLVLLVARIVQRQSPGTVLGGLLGVALGALLAIRSGDGTDFYCPGIVINAVSLMVLVLTILLRRPLVGVRAAILDPRVQDWQEAPDARRVYTRATLLFAGLYAAKLAVQLPLLLTGQVAALGAAKLAMGLPAFAVLVYLVWLMHRALLGRRARRD